MATDPATDLLVERWADLAAAAELPRLDASVIRLILDGATGPGDALLRLVVEAVAVRRRRMPRTTRSQHGEVALVFDALADVVPPGVSRALVARERRRALVRIARAVRHETFLPWRVVAAVLDVPERTLRRWAGGQNEADSGRKSNARSRAALRSQHPTRPAA
jgi:hypothetical protein